MANTRLILDVIQIFVSIAAWCRTVAESMFPRVVLNVFIITKTCFQVLTETLATKKSPGAENLSSINVPSLFRLLDMSCWILICAFKVVALSGQHVHLRSSDLGGRVLEAICALQSCEDEQFCLGDRF